MAKFSYGWRGMKSQLFENQTIVDNWKSKPPVQLLSAICDDQVYTWYARKNALIIADYQQVLETSNSKCPLKECPLKSPIFFDAHNLSVKNFNGTYGLLWGPKGAVVIHFPSFTIQTEVVKARHVNLGEKIHVECSRLNVVQAKLSLDQTKKVAVVLYNDRYLRVYDAVKGDVLAVFCATTEDQGPLNTEGLDNHYLPVDFDFGPCLPTSRYWSIVLLQASGQLQSFFVRILDKSNKCVTEYHKIKYSLESTCSLGVNTTALAVLCTKQFPVTLSISTSAGVIRHCLLYPIFDPQERLVADSMSMKCEDFSINLESKFLRNEVELKVLETVKLKSENDSELSFIKLIPDPLFEERYMCIHDFGVQLINMRFLNAIAAFVTDPSIEDFDMPQSTVRNLIRWKFPNSSLPEKCLLAASFSDTMPQTVVFVRDTYNALIYGLPDTVDHYYAKKSLEPKGKNNNSFNYARKSPNSTDVLSICNAIIRQTPNPPLILGDQDIKGKDLRHLTLQSIGSARNLISNFSEGAVHLVLFADHFEKTSERIMIALQNILADKAQLKVLAETLAEKYEERVETDELFQRRLEYVLFYLSKANPTLTDKEKCWIKTLERYEKDYRGFLTQVEGLNIKMAQGLDDKRLAHDQPRLTANQIHQIKIEISHQNEVLCQLKENVRAIKDCVSWRT